MVNDWPFDGSGTLPLPPSMSTVPFCGRHPLKVGPVRVSTRATLVTHTVPLWQSALVEHISLHNPSWQEPRLGVPGFSTQAPPVHTNPWPHSSSPAQLGRQVVKKHW